VVVTPNYALPLTLGCIGIGMLDEIPKIREGIKIIKPGSLLVSYTDGVTEQENRAGEQFGLKNLIHTVQNHINEPVEQINETIVNALNAFRNGEPYADDVTLLTNRIL
jgi:sigma-B regulation protein RsbU (phosphoserine phosphatase)